ncbi:MAG: hypothetical protein M0R32_11790 [Candidatus Cloacimonetes bacterium]|jgi:hypothetical protein|nr:hypothetical protein [Candidatus Cloacimonadota bacterium]
MKFHKVIKNKAVDIIQEDEIIGHECILKFAGKRHIGEVLMRRSRWWDKEEPWFFFHEEERVPWKVKDIIKEGGVITRILEKQEFYGDF